MTLNLSGEVGYEMLNDLVKAFNSTTDVLHLYFSAPDGGSTDVAEAIIDFINTNKEKIELVFYGEIYSAGMIIFLKTICKKRILPDTRGMYHFSWQDLSISEGGKPTSEYGVFSLKEMKNSKTRTISYLKETKLLDREVRLVKRGKEVYFSHSRMSELINAI